MYVCVCGVMWNGSNAWRTGKVYVCSAGDGEQKQQKGAFDEPMNIYGMQQRWTMGTEP